MNWPAPPWALSTDDTDGNISHQRHVGRFAERSGMELSVCLFQYERLRSVSQVVRVERDDVEIAVGDERISVAEARRLARLLTEAVDLAEP